MSVIQPDIHEEWKEIKEAIDNALDGVHRGGVTKWETQIENELVDFKFRKYELTLKVGILVVK